MFMPHANAISPARLGVNPIDTGSLSGNSFLIFRDATTTDVAHVFSLVRVKVSRAGTPARNVSRDGSKLGLPDTDLHFLHAPGALHAHVSWELCSPGSDVPGEARSPSRSRSARSERLPVLTTTFPPWAPARCGRPSTLVTPDSDRIAASGRPGRGLCVAVAGGAFEQRRLNRPEIIGGSVV